MNYLDQIFYRKLGRVPDVGEAVFIDVDWTLAHDGSLMMVDQLYKKHGFDHVQRPDRLFVAFDHIYPANNSTTANLHANVRHFVKRFDVKHFFEGRGISHQLLLEQTLVEPLEIVVGGDSHTPTIGAKYALGIGVGATDVAFCLLTGKTWFVYPEAISIALTGRLKADVFAKDVVLHLMRELGTAVHDRVIVFRSEHPLSLSERAVLCNMSPEMGAITSLFAPPDAYFPDGDYALHHTVQLGEMRPLLAMPHQVSNITEVGATHSVKSVDVVFVGTCTGGRIGDIETLATTIEQHEGRLRTRLIVCPASVEVYQEAIAKGYISTLLASGATVLPPSCGPCLGQTTGVLADNEVCVSTANRNFKGRMGNPNAEIVLASSRTAALCAVTGSLPC